jgi:predicted metalloprotease with PDZ domain
VSYYTKGALVATMLNVEIISATNCKRSLDDVLLQLYGDFQKDPSKGFTEERVKQIAEEVCGKNLDNFWKKYLDGTDELPIRNYLEKCGIETIDENEKVSCSLDIETKSENGKLLIAKVFEGGSAHSAGLNSGDEIISVDNYRVDAETMNRIIADKKNGDKIDVLIARKGIVKLIQIKLEKPLPKYKLKLAEKPGKKEKQFLEKWLNG